MHTIYKLISTSILHQHGTSVHKASFTISFFSYLAKRQLLIPWHCIPTWCSCHSLPTLSDDVAAIPCPLCPPPCTRFSYGARSVEQYKTKWAPNQMPHLSKTATTCKLYSKYCLTEIFLETFFDAYTLYINTYTPHLQGNSLLLMSL